ncbi:peroxide stress protein YaaA [Nocardioides halotolerans]|uniref:peroxide stress protein YaaA n=1 Tax=Nocardioides halotolerans TaxID=433660 RepID=UPI001FDFF13F|nr:peroxide stress protein YaaA [Nocardioides halotolerans]
MLFNLSFWLVLILLPPSEGKTAPRRGSPLDLAALSAPALTAARERVLHALVTLCSGDPVAAAAVLEVPKTQLDLVELNASLRSAPTARADAVYAGVLYDALELGTLSAAARRRATGRVRVTSSLFGLVSPADRIPAYRLSGDATLPGLGTVAGVWREALGPEITELVGDGLLVDLRSGTYAAFWRPAGLRRVATVRVLHEVAGRRQVVSHFNKATKGRIVRALLEDGANPRTPARLAEALRDLGWVVEVTEGARGAQQLDVVVSEL